MRARGGESQEGKDECRGREEGKEAGSGWKEIKGPWSAIPLFLFASKSLTITFYSEHVEVRVFWGS